MVEQAKFDPTLSVNGQYLRTVNPLNRPVFGGTEDNLTEITIFDQRNSSVTVDAQTNLLTGGNLDLNYSPAYTNVNPSVAQGFLFNPAWTGGLAMTLTQPLLRNAGLDVNKTFIRSHRITLWSRSTSSATECLRYWPRWNRRTGNSCSPMKI